MRRDLRKRRVQALAAAVVAVLGLWLLSGRLERLEFQTQDLRFELRGPQRPNPQVVLVAIDEETLLQEGPWPWSLERIARLVQVVSAQRPAAIGLNLEALVPATLHSGASPEQLARLRAVLAEAGNVVLPAIKQPPGPGGAAGLEAALGRFAVGEGVLPEPADLAGGPLRAPHPDLLAVAAGAGALNVTPETDHVLRKLPLLVSAQGRLYASFAAELVRVYRQAPPGSLAYAPDQRRVTVGGLAAPVDEAAEMQVNFAGRYGAFPRVSAARLLRGEGPPSSWAGKLVIVGLTTGAEAQVHPVPLATRLPGPEIQANAVHCLLEEDALSAPPDSLAWLFALLGALLLAGWLPAVRAPLALLITLGLVAAYLSVSFSAFFYHLLLPVSLPVVVWLITGGFVVLNTARSAELAQTQAEARIATRLRTLSGMGHLLASGLDRDRLLEEILQWVQRELQVEAVSLLLLEEGRLRFEAARGGAAEQVKDFRLALGEGIAGTVAMTGEPLIVNEAGRDPRQARDIAQAVGFEPRRILCVPMIRQDRVVGVIEALNRAGPPFGPAEADLLTVIAQQAAVFLENARLYAELQRRVDFANTELRQANRELASQKARLETVLREMASGVLATDGAEHLLMVNQSAQRLLAMDPGRAGEPVAAVLGDRRLLEMFARPLSLEGGSCVRELELPEGSGRTIRAHLTQLDLGGENLGKMLLLTDITQFVELDRMKTDLISFVSHELKNPLAALQGFVRLMRGSTAAAEEPLATYLAYVDRQARRMQYLVEDYLDVSRLEAGHPLDLRCEPITDLAALALEAVALEAGLDPQREIRLQVPPDLPPVAADRRKLQQILINLVGNALKYTTGAITIQARATGTAVELAVVDEGPGIGEPQRAHLFQRFTRLREPGAGRVPGTGLGLYLCRHLVEAHGGNMWVDSEPGQGAAFRFTLPQAPVGGPEQ